MKITAFLRLVRFPNLLMVVATQYLMQYLILIPAFQSSNINATLPGFQFALFVITTVFIAAAGYVINDFYDYEIDLYNKPNAVLVNKVFSEQSTWSIYGLLFASGLGIAVYLASFVRNPGLVLIYPLAFAVLWLYSDSLKKKPLAGNITVSLFCAFVPGVVLFAERHSFSQLSKSNPDMANLVLLLLAAYCLFAFLSTFIREIIKDIEDAQGDKKTNCRTLPLVYGETSAKYWAGGLALLLLVLLIAFSYWLYAASETLALWFSVIFVIIPQLILLYWLINAEKKKDYTKLSKLAKFIMLGGLLLLIVINL